MSATLQGQVSSIWEKALGREIEANESFFAAGGDSLAFIMMTLTLTQEFGVNLSKDDLLENPTIRGVTSALVRALA